MPGVFCARAAVYGLTTQNYSIEFVDYIHALFPLDASQIEQCVPSFESIVCLPDCVCSTATESRADRLAREPCQIGAQYMQWLRMSRPRQKY